MIDFGESASSWTPEDAVAFLRSALQAAEGAWTIDDVAAFVKLSVKSVTRLDVPGVPIQLAGQKPVMRYDPPEVRAWWAARVAEAKRAREQRPPLRVPDPADAVAPASRRRRREAIRLEVG